MGNKGETVTRVKGWVLICCMIYIGTSQMALVVKNLPANAGDVRDVGSTPGLGRFSGVENGNPF